MKHVVFCDWPEIESMQILRVCSEVLKKDGGKLIIAEAVLPDPPNAAVDKTTIFDRSSSERGGTRGRLQLYSDALMMLVGRSSAKTETEWIRIAKRAGFHLEAFHSTPMPTCSLIILSKIM